MLWKVQDGECLCVWVSYSNNSNKSTISVWAKWMMSAKWLDTRNVQNKNKTPSSPTSVYPFTESSACVYVCVGMSEYANFLRHYGLELFDSFPCDFIVLALSTNTIYWESFFRKLFIRHGNGHSHSHVALFRACVSIFGIFKWIETKFRNSLYLGRNHHLIATHIHREIKSISNEWIYAWNTDLNVHFEINHERYMPVFACAKISRRTKWALKLERKAKEEEEKQ